MMPTTDFATTQRSALAASLDRFDFGEADVILESIGYRETAHCRQLCAVGMEVRQLDAEEFGKRTTNCVPLPRKLRDTLRAAAWPSTLADQRTGALVDLRPTYRLLLELVEVNVGQRNWTDVLALIHLMSEYLPLLAWQPLLGHAGIPRDIANRFDTRAAQSPRPPPERGCALGKPGSDLADQLQTPPMTDAALRKYLRTKYSRVSGLLLICGGAPDAVVDGRARACRRQCSVVTGPDADLDESDRESLARRVTMARRFADSPIVGLRHTSPVGHFFSVPGKDEIDDAWHRTRNKLLKTLADMSASDQEMDLISSGLVDGLQGLVGYCSGSDKPTTPSTILVELRDAIVRAT